MSAVQSYLMAVGNNQEKAQSIAGDTAKALESKQVSFIEVVQSLGEYINDEQASTRAGAVEYLARVIGQLASAFLSRQQVQVLCEFLCERIEDGGAIVGLMNLVQMTRFNGEMAVTIFRAIVEHFKDLQVHPQGQRKQIFELLNILMAKHRKTLQGLGKESIVGITDIVAGEKDPRNLMIVFSILKVVMVEWDIAEYAEILFDSAFCYFPITFRPPPDDPYGITAQDLKDRLRDCISASGYFAPYTFPQLLDKLDSTSTNAKRDVLQTIAACALAYPPNVISNYSTTLWDSLKFEILNVQEEDLAEEALKALQAVASCLSQGPESTDLKSPLAAYLRPITKESNEQLREPQHKQAKPIGQILSALGVVSPTAYFFIIKAVLPPLSVLYQDSDAIADQRALLEVVVQLLDAGIAVYGSPNIPAPATDIVNPLEPFKDRLFEVSSQALMSTPAEETSFRIVALKALLRLCLLRRYLQDQEFGMVIQYLDELILTEDSNGRDDLKKEAINALVELSRIKPHLITDITFPAFMSRLPDAVPEDDRSYIVTLEGLAQLSVDKFVSDMLIRRLLNRLDAILVNQNSPEYAKAVLSALLYVLHQRDLSSDTNLQFYFEKIVLGLVIRSVQGALNTEKATALNDASVIEVLSRLIATIIHALDAHKRKSIGLQCYTLFMDPSGPLVPLAKAASDAQRLTMILSTAIMASVHVEAPIELLEIEFPSSGSLVEKLIDLVGSESLPAVRQAGLRQIGLLINKFTPASQLEQYRLLFDTRVDLLKTQQEPCEGDIRIIVWIAKALLLRQHGTQDILKRLLELLGLPAIGSQCAKGFFLLLAPDEVLTKENGAIIRLLAKQRIFAYSAPVIAAGVRNADDTIKSNYLIALSGLLKYMPTEVMMQGIDTILPLLLQTLDLNMANVKAATIEVLIVVSHESPDAVESHIGSLVTRLLSSTAVLPRNDVSVRLNALKCLKIFPGRVKESTLLPHKTSVITALRMALDDPKRSVRREAVDCRTAWNNMDEPQSD